MIFGLLFLGQFGTVALQNIITPINLKSMDFVIPFNKLRLLRQA